MHCRPLPPAVKFVVIASMWHILASFVANRIQLLSSQGAAGCYLLQQTEWAFVEPYCCWLFHESFACYNLLNLFCCVGSSSKVCAADTFWHA